MINDGLRFFAPWSSDEDVNYSRYNDDEPCYFVRRSGDEDASYLRVNGDGHRYFAPRSRDEDKSYLRLNGDFILHRGQVTRMRDT